MPTKNLLRSALAVTFLLPFALLIASCLPVPLGDPAASKVEDAYAGAWLWEADDDSRHLVVLRPWDGRTYYVRMITLSHKPGNKKAELAVMKGWLTKVKEETFLTLQDAEDLSTLPGEDEEKVYVTMKLNLVDERLLATLLDPSFPPFEVLRSPEELARLIEQHIDNPEMWVDTPMTARRATKDDREAFEEALSNAIADNAPAAE